MGQSMKYSLLGVLLLGGLLYYYFVLSVPVMENVTLRTVGGTEVNMQQCPAETCLVVFLSPKCRGCNRYFDLIEELRYLLRRGYGIPTKVVIGGDTPKRCREMAKVFGSDTVLDPTRKMHVMVESQFIAIDQNGKLIKSMAAPSGKKFASPIPDETLRKVARELGLI